MSAIMKSDRIPLYIQLKNLIKQSIDNGNLQPGEKIPSEAELQKMYEMSRVTIRKAIDELAKEGYLVKIQGKGTFVSQAGEEELTKNVRSFTDICKMQGRSLISEVLFAGLKEGNVSQCEFFGIPAGSEVMCIQRVRKVNGVPVVLETNYFHPLLEFLKYDDLRYSLYELLQNKYHIYPSGKGLNEVSIINVEGEEARLLQMEEGTSAIFNNVHVYDSKSKPVHTVDEIVRVDLPEIFRYYL